MTPEQIKAFMDPIAAVILVIAFLWFLVKVLRRMTPVETEKEPG